MPPVIVHLVAAVICWNGQCYPALLGHNTPQGLFHLHRWRTTLPGYGGDILAFARDQTGIFAIHRVLQTPTGLRVRKLKRGSVEIRRDSTDGCINVMPDVYRKLIDCCSYSTLTIEP